MNDIQERIAVSFKSQGLMATLGADWKVVAIMQATIVNVRS